ncbi:FOG: TPR repeat, SEL1 subfamily [hydrothermal vent metagenome]|uniref:FOG: TPR repeat, SEL1 subfamily n=1 Tax=hydrothermal vent metagenome TaxID=652676 RepID=A0A3B0UCA3_9ZZZZ
MRRLYALGLLIFSLSSPAFAQINSTSITDNADAKAISAEIFGPKRQTDLAFGAFQRGYYLTALSLALDRAGKNNSAAAAQTLIATIYANGLGVAENMALASSWYAIAAKNGDVNATFQLALLYQNGRGVPRDRKRGAELFAQAAKMGSPEAKYNLALLHVEGIYATPSYSEAARLMKEAAAAGLAEAHYNYGIMLSEGAGVAPDAKAGANEIKIAAQMGLSEAQVEYATILYLGKGINRNLARAVFWYRQAANAGNPVAQNRLAKLIAAGEGVKLDLQTAAMWRSLARRQGLVDPGLDRLLVSITPEDQARADQRARFWPGVVQSKTSAPPLAPANAGDAMGKAMLNMDKLLEPQKIVPPKTTPIAPSGSPAK